MDGEEKMKKAYESILENDFEQAIDWFEQAIQSDPDNAAYHYKLSITYARSNKLKQALHHANIACQIEPSHRDYILHLQHLQAKELLFQAEKLFDRSTDELNKAIPLLRKAILLDPLASEAFLLLGLAYAELKAYNEAVSAMNEVLKLDPQHEIANRLRQQYESILQNKH